MAPANQSTQTPLHLRVFLASPSDVAAERVLALRVLEQLSRDPLLRDRLTLEAVAWDQPGAGAPMLATMTPQASIAAGLPKPSECDILVVIIWSRMGTPLSIDEYRKPDGSAYLSGTEWEYLDALEGAKHCGRPEVLVYRRTEKCLLDPCDPQIDDKLRQYRSVEAFFAGFRNPDNSIRAGFNECLTPEAFRDQLDHHLRSLVQRLLDRPPPPSPLCGRDPRPEPRPIFGRDTLIESAVNKLKSYSFALVGPKGIGKSKLASAIFERLAVSRELPFERYFWSRFTYGAAPSFSDFSKQLIEDLSGKTLDFSNLLVSDQVGMVVRYLRDNSCLLVIDQFEATIDPETRQPRDPGFRELMKHAREGLWQARLLVTSWEIPKDADGVQIDYLEVPGLSGSDGVEFMVYELSRVLPHNSEIIDETELKDLVSRLQGHPLALQMMARNNPVEIIREFTENQDICHQAIQEIAENIVDQVYRRQHWSREWITVLRTLATFDSFCSKPAILAVTGLPRQKIHKTIAELQQRMWLIVFAEGVYDLEVLVREYVRQHMSADQARQFNARAADYFLMEAGQSSPDTLYSQRLDSALVGLHHLIRARQQEKAASIFLDRGIHDIFYRAARWSTLASLYEAFVGSELSPETLSLFLGNLGLVYRDLLRYQEAKECYQRGLLVSQRHGDKIGECRQLVNLGDIANYEGAYETAIDYHQRAQALLETVNLPSLAARNLGCLGNALSSQNRIDEAENCYEQAIVLCEQCKDWRYKGIWLGDLGIVYEQKKDVKKAIQYFDRPSR